MKFLLENTYCNSSPSNDPDNTEANSFRSFELTTSYNFKNSLIIHEENTKKNHKRVVSLYVTEISP